MEVVVTTGAISHVKLQSNHHHQQTNTQIFTCMLFLSKHWRKNITFQGLAHANLTWGLPTSSWIQPKWKQYMWCYWNDGKLTKHLWAILSFKFEMKMRVAWYTAAAVHRSGCRKSRICVQQMMMWTKHQQLLSTTSKWLSNTYIHPCRLFRNFLHIWHTNADFVSAVNTVARWRSGSVLDMRSIGRGFESQPPCRVKPWASS